MAEATLEQDIERIARGEHPNPFGVLGLHRVRFVQSDSLALRAFVPWATRLEVLRDDNGETAEMSRVHDAGFFEAVFPPGEPFRYRLRADGQGGTREFHDPYSFPTTFTDLDLHLLGEGTDLELYRKLGAHMR